MRYQFGKKQLGITLVEMLLVCAIIGSLFVMYIGYTRQRSIIVTTDRASQQMQQILNAALSYYNVNGDWPLSLAALQAPNTPYIPTPFTSPWNTPYLAAPVSVAFPLTKSVVFKVTVSVPNIKVHGLVLAGKLPTGRVDAMTVIATVNLPAEVLNNAAAVNFAGLYKLGACVPVPACPLSATDGSSDVMTPEVILTPVSISGANDANEKNVYPLTSYTAYAKGPDTSPPGCSAATPPDCSTAPSPTGRFWRVCVSVSTSKGDVDWTDTILPPVIMAMTRCVIKNEASGSAFTVFGP